VSSRISNAVLAIAMGCIFQAGCGSAQKKPEPGLPEVATPEHEAADKAVEAGLLRAQAHYDIADYEAARREYGKVLVLDPDNQDAKAGLDRAARAKAMVQGTNALDWGGGPPPPP
jgi:hypothetical protein